MSNEDEPRGLNILCIDGGGARGLSSLIVLREIMNRLNGLGDGDGELKPSDCFDVIAGSGTGGLSACMLGRLRMPLDSTIQEYTKLIQDVFADKKTIRRSGPSAYKGTKLREMLQQIVSKVGKDGKTMEEVVSPEDCKTIIFAMSKHNISAALPSMFRSYGVVANRGPDCTILDALCATMAHPNLFKDIEIEEGALHQSFISGDLGCSNPMAHVLAEVKRVYPGRHVSCILSIGAGHARTISIPDHSLPEQIFRTQDLAAMKDMATDSERVAEEMAIRFGATNRVYFRFNVDQGIQDIKAGDWERLYDVMAHAKVYLLKIDTNQRMKDLVQAIKKQSNSLEVELIDGQVEQKFRVRRPPRLRRCPAPTSVYTGRKDEAKQVIGCLLENGYVRPICVIYGLGGSGKTQLALKVVEQTRNNWTEVLYIDGTSRETIESALEAFASVKNIGHTYQDSIDWLGSCLGQWLMVFDGIDDPSIGANLCRYIPAGIYGSMLITTRLTDLAFLARGTGSVCRMSPGMKPEESLALFTKVARLLDWQLAEAEMKAAIALMEDSGHLALAIVHASAYIAHSPSLTISKYRSFSHAQRRRALEEYSKLKVSVDDYTKTVYTTWEMSYNRLKQDTRPMLWLIAFLDHNSITEKIFERATINTQNPLARVSLLPPTETTTSAYHHVANYLRQFLDPSGGWDSLRFLNVINELASYSLINFDRMNDAYSIHILVQDWAKTKVEQEQGMAFECTATLLSLSIGFESSDDSLGLKEFMASLEMHLDCFLANKQTTARDYHRQFAKVYRELKRWQQVEDLETKVYQEMNRTLGEKHMYTLGCMVDLASTYLNRDLLDIAEELQRRALDTQREVLGQDHPHTQRSITNLTSIYLKQGRWDEAEKVQLQGLNSNAQLQQESFIISSQASSFQPLPHSKRELIHEREFLNMLRGKTNLALVYSNQGRLVEAEVLQNEVLNAYQSKFTEEHLDTIASMLNLASIYCKQNRYDESTKLCLRVAELQIAMFGKEDLGTIKCMAELAGIYFKQGQWTKAETLQQRVLNSCKQVLGAEHPDTIRVIAQLAETQSKLKQDYSSNMKGSQSQPILSYKQTSRITRAWAVVHTVYQTTSKLLSESLTPELSPAPSPRISQSTSPSPDVTLIPSIGVSELSVLDPSQAPSARPDISLAMCDSIDDIALETKELKLVLQDNTTIQELVAYYEQHRLSNYTESLRQVKLGAEAPIADGPLANVYKVNLSNQQWVAVKCVKHNTLHKKLKRAARELSCWLSCKHENILPILGFAVVRGDLAMVSPWMSNGCITRYVANSLNCNLLLLCTQLARAITYLHEQNLVHGDIKGANVLVSDTGVVQVMDFGVSIKDHKGIEFTKTSAGCGTQRWQAPEIICGHTDSTEEGDVYALSMTMIEIFTGEPPYGQEDWSFQTITKVVHGTLRPSRPITLPIGATGNAVWELIKSCWVGSPENRPKCASVYEQLTGFKI